MRGAIGALDALLVALRSISGALVVAAAVLAALAWGVRTRRIGAFSPVARFTRRVADPLLAPLERRLVRVGIAGPAAPWWGVLAVILLCAAAIFLVGFVREAFVGTYLAANAGPRGLLVLAVRLAFTVLQIALLARVVMSWVGGAHAAAGRLARRLTEWFLAPLRRLLPPMGMVDLSPLVAWFLLILVERAVLTVL